MTQATSIHGSLTGLCFQMEGVEGDYYAWLTHWWVLSDNVDSRPVLIRHPYIFILTYRGVKSRLIKIY